MSVAVRTPAQELAAQVRSEEFQGQVALALPEGMAPRRFVRAAVTALLSNPDIAQASRDSLFQSLIRCAQDGLLPDGKEAALVIFNTKVGDKWEKRAQYMSMIGGLRKIAAEHGWSLATNVVYTNDTFDYTLGLNPSIEHKPARLGTDRGAPIGAYAVATHKDGRKQVEVLTTQEIEKVRGVSRSKDKGPWVDWWERMAEKTAGRRLFAKLPLGERDDRVARVLEASDDPPASARLMYGPDGDAAFQVTPASLSPADVEDLGTEVFDGQQASGGDDPAAVEAAATPPEGPATSSPPDAPDPEIDAIRDAADLAGMVTLENGKHKGRTIAQVAADPKDRSYLAWLLRQSDHPLLADTRIYCSVHCPDLAEQAAAQMALEGRR